MRDARLESSAPERAGWNYAVPAGGHWDEALDPSGAPRPHWRKLIVSLRRMGYGEFDRRWQLGQRLFRANGVTYNVYGDPQGQERPWQMDLLPLAIDGAEWDRVASAIVQRVTLLNAVLADLYGERRLISERWLPAELVLANRSFLRPCVGMKPPHGVFIQNYAVDLARAPDGGWWVISDRTQAPSGMGYALENRLVSARALPSVLEQCQVRSLSRFFDTTLDALLALAPARRDNPRIVVLTPGPHNETYFEHSYLSQHWGFPLVGGADLTVRDSRVYLKTLSGLNPVDIIVRRMDDTFCDPLELRSESVLGVPGLLQAVRAGNVFVANSLGSGVVETHAIMAFLPGLCRHLLGEDLRLPSVATWWCGEDEPRRRVLASLENVVIKPTFPRFGRTPEFPATMSADARCELADRIRAHPDRFVAQEQVDLSTTPVHTERGIEARHVVLRAMAAWDGSSYTVMPGGLTRVATGARSLVVSMQMGGGSKDTWVVGREARDSVEPAPKPLVVDAGENATELASRVADNLYWLGRYTERLDAYARLLRALLPGVSGESEFGRGGSIETTIHFLHGLGLVPTTATPRAKHRRALQRLLGQAVFDPTRESSVGWHISQIRRVSWETKERLSHDAWRVLQELESNFSDVQERSGERRFVLATAQLDHVVIMLAAFAGLLAEHPTRGHGWRFLDIGRRMERALQMIELLRVGVHVPPPLDDACLEVLLHVTDSATAYRSRFLTTVRSALVLELLLADESHPRSVAYQLTKLAARIGELPSTGFGGQNSLESALAARLVAMRREVHVDEVAGETPHARAALLEHLLTLRDGLYELSQALTARYLAHSLTSRLRSSS